MWCYISTGASRSRVPEDFSWHFYDYLNDLVFSGVQANNKMISSKCMQLCIYKEFWQEARSCMPCQLTKMQRHNKALPASFHFWKQHIHIDIVALLPESHDCFYLLIVIDRFTRVAGSDPIQHITAVTVAHNLVDQ